tara:strand:- start:1946 stop:2692 length:747 start_codon:yes stop_codon:yes gene_type:complete
MSDSRTALITRDFVAAINEIVRRHDITHDEYRSTIDFLTEAVSKGETSLLFDAFLESDVVAANAEKQEGTPQQVLGPFYLPDMPWLENGQLAGDNEPGERLTVQGTVRGTNGESLSGSELDFWQCDAEGRYSNFMPGLPDGHLRGRMKSENDGSYTLKTIRPSPYPIPHEGPTGRLLKELGRHPWRPAHLHVIARHEGYRPLTSQVYFQGDKYLDSDAVRAATDKLAFALSKDENGSVMKFDIELEAV